MTCKTRTFTTADELFRELFAIGEQPSRVAFRGVSDAKHGLTPSLDRALHVTAGYEAWLGTEKKIFTEFRERASWFLGRHEQAFLGVETISVAAGLAIFIGNVQNIKYYFMAV